MLLAAGDKIVGFSAYREGGLWGSNYPG